jgi:hypothetical protein
MLEPNVTKLGLAFTVQLKAAQQRHTPAAEEQTCGVAVSGG